MDYYSTALVFVNCKFAFSQSWQYFSLQNRSDSVKMSASVISGESPLEVKARMRFFVDGEMLHAKQCVLSGETADHIKVCAFGWGTR